MSLAHKQTDLQLRSGAAQAQIQSTLAVVIFVIFFFYGLCRVGVWILILSNLIFLHTLIFLYSLGADGSCDLGGVGNLGVGGSGADSAPSFAAGEEAEHSAQNTENKDFLSHSLLVI